MSHYWEGGMLMKAPFDVLDVSRYTINYSNMKGYGISNLKLQKILYFIQAYFLINNDGIPCFSEKIEAWDLGPVVREAYNEFKQYGSTDIPSITSYFVLDDDNIWNSEQKVFDDAIIDPYQKSMIDTVVDKFKDYSATDLVNLTHRQAPWRQAYKPYQNNEITNNSIREYFS